MIFPQALADYKHQYYLPAQKDGYSGVALLSKIEPLKVDLGFGTDEAKEHDAGKYATGPEFENVFPILLVAF